MSETSWEKLVPKTNEKGQEVKLTEAEKAMNTVDLIKRLTFLPPDATEESDFDIYTTEEPTRDLRTVIPKIKVFLPNKYWWLHEKWQNKEIADVFKLSQGNEVYDFSGEINHEKLVIVESVNEFFTKLLAKYNLEPPKYLLFDNSQVVNFNSGNPMNGQVTRGWDAIHFYPECFAEGKYRVKEKSQFPESVEHFTAVVIHEYSHLLEPKFANEWRKNFDWVNLEKAIELSENNYKYEECTSPETCMSDYALFHSKEDFCESMTAFLLCPEKLKEISNKKYEFLKSIIGDVNFETSKTEVKDMSKEQKWPQLPARITVKLEKSKLRWK
jgi:hypothetical protein